MASPQTKRAIDEKVLNELFEDDIIPDSSLALRKVNGFIARQLLFFSTQTKEIKVYEPIKISEVTH